jgi:hypothetical protein
MDGSEPQFNEERVSRPGYTRFLTASEAWTGLQEPEQAAQIEISRRKGD